VSSRFDTTQWSVVLAARRRSEPGGEEALARLCEAYWFPLYAFVRRQGYRADEARDLTQAYFLKLFEKDFLDDVAPEAGRFRSFLLASMKHFLINEWKKERTAKRGGEARILSLEFDDAERWLRSEPADHDTPESQYERRWARVVLQLTTELLRQEFAKASRAEEFRRLEPLLVGGSATGTYAEIAKDLGRSVSAIKMAVSRMRRRFGELLRVEIGRTLTDPEEIDAEIRYLFQALRRP
jgi:RNA polymerase sigma-70 factor (ECF subfamily)